MNNPTKADHDTHLDENIEFRKKGQKNQRHRVRHRLVVAVLQTTGTGKSSSTDKKTKDGPTGIEYRPIIHPIFVGGHAIGGTS